MMISNDLRQATIRVARAHKWVRESSHNRGEFIDALVRSVGMKPEDKLAWCAMFVSYIGRSVCGALLWPLPNVAGCVSLAESASKLKLLYPDPAFCAIFLLWSDTLNRFRHTGFICSNTPSLNGWMTVEGNSNTPGSPEGDGVYERERVFGPRDQFIYWWKEPDK